MHTGAILYLSMSPSDTPLMYTDSHSLYNNTYILQSPPPGPDSLSKGRSLRSGRTIPDPLEPQRVDSIDSEPVMISESSESEADEWKSDGDSDDSSDVSDWTAEAGIKIINESRRKRRRRKISNHEDEISSEEEYGDEEEEEEGEPGPSKRAEQRKERSTEGLGLLTPSVKRESKPKKKRLVREHCSKLPLYPLANFT